MFFAAIGGAQAPGITGRPGGPVRAEARPNGGATLPVERRKFLADEPA